MADLSPAAQFNQFMSHVEQMLAGDNPDMNMLYPTDIKADKLNNVKLTTDAVRNCQKVWTATMRFCQESNLLNPVQNAASTIDQIAGSESFLPGVQLSGVGVSNLETLCNEAGITKDPVVRRDAYAALSSALLRHINNSDPQQYTAAHFRPTSESNAACTENYGAMYSQATLGNAVSLTAVPGQEAFGANIDKVITDTRMTIAVTLLRFHKSCLNRIAHRRPRATTRIEYEIPYAEFYSLEDSQNSNADIRNGRQHRVIFLDLYRDPTPVRQRLTPIVPLLANAKNGELRANGIIASGKDANLFSLSLDSNVVRNNHTDWTDLVSDAVTLNKVILVLSDGTNTEEFTIDTESERLLPTVQNRDSSYRQCSWKREIKLYKNMPQSSGTASTILSTLTEDDCIVAEFRYVADIYLKTADTHGYGSVTLRAYSKGTGSTSTLGAAVMAKNPKADLVGYSLNAYFSEENLRKSNIMFRTNKFMRSYEILCGTNFMIDYSLGQELEEFSMAMVTEGMSIGMDDRAIAMFRENADLVHDRLLAENYDNGHLKNNLERLNFDFVAGTRVNPFVYIDSIDMRKVDTIRSSDYMSDARQYFDTRLTRILSLGHAESLYPQQLEPGEEIVYKMIASRIVIENLLSVPHIHNNVQQLENMESDGQVVEFARKLTSGITLHCVSLPWDKMRDKIIIMPFRPNFPDSELNYCHNWDYGTFLAHYTPQIANGVNKRIFMNGRETPVITNPYIYVLTVAYFDTLVDLTVARGH